MTKTDTLMITKDIYSCYKQFTEGARTERSLL